MQEYSDHKPINIGTGEDYSIREIAEEIKKTVGFTGELCFDASKPDGVFRKVMDVTRIHTMGWKHEISLHQGISNAYRWFEENYDSLMMHPIYRKKPFFLKSKRIAGAIKKFLINPRIANKSLDDPETTIINREIIESKPFLKKLYIYYYSDFIEAEKSLESLSGISLELGSGGGFLKKILPSVVTSDVALFPGTDRVENATKLSFRDGELRAIYMSGVLHHIGKAKEFFREAERCLAPGGKIVMMEPHMSFFGRIFFKIFHYEANDMRTLRWDFPQTGPLSGANTALPYLIFDNQF